MPFTSKRSQSMMGKTNAKKSKQVHGEPSSTSPSEVVDPMDVEHGEPMRTTVPIRPDPALETPRASSLTHGARISPALAAADG